MNWLEVKKAGATFLAALAVLHSGGNAMAHPGHSLFEHGLGHAVSNPLHFALLLLIGGGLFALGHVAKTPLARKACRGVGTLSIGLAVVFAIL